MFPVYCVKDVTGFYPPDHSPLEGERVMSRDDDFLGARASRPHKAWHGFAYLPHFDQPGMAPLLSFQLANAVSADRVAACSLDGQVGAVGQGLAWEHALAGTGCGRDARAPRRSLPP